MAGSVSASRGARKASSSGGQSIKKALAPIVFLVGLLLIAPGIWAVAILAGMDVPKAKSNGAGSMAMLMLISWPVAVMLLVGGVLMWRSGKKPVKKKKMVRPVSVPQPSSAEA